MTEAAIYIGCVVVALWLTFRSSSKPSGMRYSITVIRGHVRKTHHCNYYDVTQDGYIRIPYSGERHIAFKEADVFEIRDNGPQEKE